VRIHTDSDGRAVNAISAQYDGTDVLGSEYQLLAGGRQMTLSFQRGAPAEHGINGTTNEAVLQVLIHRLVVLNAKLHSDFNEQAIYHLGEALEALQARAAERVAPAPAGEVMGGPGFSITGSGAHFSGYVERAENVPKPFSLESDEPMAAPACSLDGGACEACQ